MDKQEYEKQAPRPEPEAYGYTTAWPSDEQRDAYHKALNTWVEKQSCPFLHTVKKTVWIPYSVVVEARGAKVGDLVKEDIICTITDLKDDGTVLVQTLFGNPKYTFRTGIESLLFEVKATYTFS